MSPIAGESPREIGRKSSIFCRSRKRLIVCSCCLFNSLVAVVLSSIVLGWQLAAKPTCDPQTIPEHLVPACAAINVLEKRWYEPWAGGWRGSEFWGSAHALQATIDFMAASGSRNFAHLVAHVHTLRPKLVIIAMADGSYDDALWWSNAYISAFELLGGSSYLESGAGIFNEVYQRAWDETTCGGGLWWSSERKYKNAITNELALLAAVKLHSLTSEARYLKIARDIWSWFHASGMINWQHLVNDGLDSRCQNNGQTVWTYNQGVILGGLILLDAAVPNETMLEHAEQIAHAAVQNLVDSDGILQEDYLANSDGVQFKGIFVRHLRLLVDSLPPNKAEQRAFFITFLQKNAKALLAHDETKDGTFGGDWNSPAQPELLLTVQSSSALRHSNHNKTTWQLTDPAQRVGSFCPQCASAAAQTSALDLLTAQPAVSAEPSSRGKGWFEGLLLSLRKGSLTLLRPLLHTFPSKHTAL